MFYIFHGDEEFLRSEEIAKFKAQIMEDGLGDLNITVLDGRKVQLDELVNACNTPPFLGSRRLIIVEGLLQRLEPQGRVARGGDDESGPVSEQSIAKRLLEYLPNLPSPTRLCFVETKSLNARNPLLKFAAQHADAYVKEFTPVEKHALSGWLHARAKTKGVPIEHEAVDLLRDFVGNDLRALDNELEKLAARVEYTQPIAAEHVRELVSATIEANIFAMVDAVGLRNREAALRQLERLIADDQHELYLLTMVARQFRLLVAAKEMVERGAGASEIARELRVSPYHVSGLINQTRRFSMRELERIQQRLLELDQEIKTGRMDGKLGLELLVVQICRGSARSSTPYQQSRRLRSR